MILHRNLLNQLGFHPVQSGTISYFSMTHSLRIVRLIFYLNISILPINE